MSDLKLPALTNLKLQPDIKLRDLRIRDLQECLSGNVQSYQGLAQN